MTIRIKLEPHIVEMLERQAADQGLEFADHVKEVLTRHAIDQALRALHNRKRPQSVDELKPHNPPPPGSNGMDRVFGQWPGDETTEELLAALKEMD